MQKYILIPQGAAHSLENHTDKDIEFIEIQRGIYLGQDDVVLLEEVSEHCASEVSLKQNMQKPLAA